MATTIWSLVFIAEIFLAVLSFDCDNGSCDDTASFNCASSNCVLNCYDSTGCAGKPIRTSNPNPTSTMVTNCYGDSSCAGTTITIEGRNAYINCYGFDSCDDLTVDFTGQDPNNLVEIIVNMEGQYTDTVRIDCMDSGSEATISLCEVNCIAPPLGGFHTCIDVDLSCNTKGNCHYKCETGPEEACCGCTLPGTCNECNILHKNELFCNHGDGNSNCIQVW